MKHWLRGLGLAAGLIATSSLAPGGACNHSYCSITCDGTEYFVFDLTLDQCCGPNIPSQCPSGTQFQRVNYWFNGCSGRRFLCPV
ncbi:MAG TPA: hypothetical protein VF173_10950 [Thermoanaerobaculia bacterium]|nr:hypothetical protein [Thermoanaerobaculia bacterium]